MSGQTVCPGHFIARDKALVVIELEAGWALEMVWMFWRWDNSLVSAKLRTPDLPVCIVVILTMLLHTDLKIIQKCVLIKWDGRFGFVVFDSWQEFLEGFSEEGNLPWSSVKGNNFGTRVKFMYFVECCSHLTNIQNYCLLWQCVFLEQLDCGEWILNSSYGNVLSSLYLMSHCLWSTTVTLS